MEIFSFLNLMVEKAGSDLFFSVGAPYVCISVVRLIFLFDFVIEWYLRGSRYLEVRANDYKLVMVVDIRDANFITHLECVSDFMIRFANDDGAASHLAKLALAILCL